MSLNLFKKFSLALFFFLIFPLFAKAVTFGNPLAGTTFRAIINGLLNFIFWASIVIFPVIALVAIFYFITSGGNPEQINKAKKIFFYAVLGLIIIFFSRGIRAIIDLIAPRSALEIATEKVCDQVDCGIPTGVLFARLPVDNFDANKNNILNEHNLDGPNITSYCIDDNLETLCGFYYRCKIGGCPPGDKTGFDRSDPANWNLITASDWTDWHNCCIVDVCGCP